MNSFRASLKPPAESLHPVIKQLFNIAAERGVKDEALASMAGYSPNAMRGWRRGKQAPDFVAIADLAAALGYEVTLREPSSS